MLWREGDENAAGGRLKNCLVLKSPLFLRRISETACILIWFVEV